MKAIIVALAFAASAIACGDNAYRCKNPQGTIEDDWKFTQDCMQRVGFEDTCWCYHRAQTYADPGSQAKIEAFQKCCNSLQNYAAAEC